MYVCMYMYTYMYTYIHTHIYIQNIHIYIYIYKELHRGVLAKQRGHTLDDALQGVGEIGRHVVEPKGIRLKWVWRACVLKGDDYMFIYIYVYIYMYMCTGMYMYVYI